MCCVGIVKIQIEIWNGSGTADIHIQNITFLAEFHRQREM